MELNVGEAFIPLWSDDFEHYALYGGRGGGKSHGIGEAVVAKSCQRQERVVCGRQFQNSIRDSVKELLEKKINAMGMAVYFSSTDRELINVSTGSRFSFIGMDRNPDSAKSLEGATLFWGEEAQTFTERSVEIIIPTIRAAGSRMMWSWNPRYRTDPVDVMFRSSVPPEAAYIRSVSWRDNPFFYQTRMPSELRRSLRAKPKRHQHIWEGGYDENPEAAIFEWEIGQVEVPDKARPRFGLDFGFSADPTFLVKVYLLPEIDTIFIAQEAMGHRVTNRNLGKLLDQVTEVRDFHIVGDSSRPETIEYLGSDGFNVHKSRKGKGSVMNGINWMQGYRIVVAPDCVNMQAELRAYHWALDPQGKPLPFPADGQQDHGIDAVRYALEEDSLSATQGEDVDYL